MNEQSAAHADSISIKDFVESTWFKLLSRVAIIAAAVLLGVFCYMLNGLLYRVDRVEEQFPLIRADITELNERAKSRATQNDRFQSSVEQGMLALRTDVSTIKVETVNLRTTIDDLGATRSIIGPKPPNSLQPLK